MNPNPIDLRPFRFHVQRLVTSMSEKKLEQTTGN